MPLFQYTARNKAGEKVDGTIEGNDRRAILLQLERNGLIPITVVDKTAAPAAAKGKPRFRLQRRTNRLNTRELLVFTTELSDLLASGMTLGNALNALANRRSGRETDQIIGQLRDEIVRGSSLSNAMAMHPQSFTKLYISMIRAGEASGALSDVLTRLVEHYERYQETKEKVVMAMIYPAIILVMGIGIIIFTMVEIMPKFQTIFESLGQNLPLPTQMLISASNFTTRYGLFLLIGITITATLLTRFVRTTEKGRLWWDGLLIKTPIIRSVIVSGMLANMARTLGTLLSNGVSILQALTIVEQVVGNVIISREIRNARERVTDGTTISGPLAASKVFPELMTDMLAVGEQTGDMPGALKHIARRYEGELDRNLRIMTTALEPILIIGVASGVGFVAISILMAVFSITNGLGE